jgi:hypothetical protein
MRMGVGLRLEVAWMAEALRLAAGLRLAEAAAVQRDAPAVR